MTTTVGVFLCSYQMLGSLQIIVLTVTMITRNKLNIPMFRGTSSFHKTLNMISTINFEFEPFLYPS